MKNVRFIGLEIPAETIAVAEAGREVLSVGAVPNRPESVLQLVNKARQTRRAAGMLPSGSDGVCIHRPRDLPARRITSSLIVNSQPAWHYTDS